MASDFDARDASGCCSHVCVVEGAQAVAGTPSSGATCGRFAVAARAMRPGDVAMSFPALGALLHDHHRGRRCDWCLCCPEDTGGGGGAEKFLRCGRCKEVYYCDRACQRADWAAGHKLECGGRGVLARALAQTGIEGPDAVKDVLLAGRCIRASAAADRPPGGVLADLETAAGRVDEGEERVVKHIAEVAASSSPELFSSGVARTGSSSLADAVADAMLRFRNNNFAVVDGLFLSVAAGCFPMGASSNHSCAPNCLMAYELTQGRPPRQALRVMEPVAEGAELTHSYVELSMPSWERQANLRDTYVFDCACAGCSGVGCQARDLRLVADTAGQAAVCRAGGVDAEAKLPRAGPCSARERDLAKAADLMDQALAEEDVGREVQMLTTACSLRGKWLGPCHLDLAEAHAQAHKAAMAAGDWLKAAEHCEAVVDQYLEVYPAWHPMTGIQMSVLGELYEEAGQADRAAPWLRRSLDILGGTHGLDHPLTRGLRARAGPAAAVPPGGG